MLWPRNCWWTVTGAETGSTDLLCICSGGDSGTLHRQILGLTLKRCLFLFQLPGHLLWDSKRLSKLESDPSFRSCMDPPRILWPLPDHEEQLKKQVGNTNSSQTCSLKSGHMTCVCASAASVSFPDTPPAVHECWEEASKREPTAQETHEKDSKVTTLFSFHHFLSSVRGSLYANSYFQYEIISFWLL